MFSHRLLEEHVHIADELSEETTTSAPTATKELSRKERVFNTFLSFQSMMHRVPVEDSPKS
jgi:hypothetical protein